MADSTDLISEAVAQQMISRYSQAIQRILADNPDLTEDELLSLLYDYSTGALDDIAAGAIRQAIQDGRGDELSDLLDSGAIPDTVVWRRSSVLEPSTCDPCAAADGTEIDGPDEDLSAICDGDYRCRCIPYADLSGEEG